MGKVNVLVYITNILLSNEAQNLISYLVLNNMCICFNVYINGKCPVILTPVNTKYCSCVY